MHPTLQKVLHLLQLPYKNRHVYRILCAIIAALVILIFSLALPVSSVTNNKNYAFVIGVTLAMSILWTTNAIHSAIVALIPVYMFPLLGTILKINFFARCHVCCQCIW